MGHAEYQHGTTPAATTLRTLIIDADEQVARERADQLVMDGHLPAVANTTHAALLKLRELPDALVLGVLGSSAKTIGLLRALRDGDLPASDSTVPVLVVGADEDQDVIRYYRAGADLTLPTSSSPLLIAAALDALGRRAVTRRRPRLMRVGRLIIDREARIARVDDRPLQLTRLEFDLLLMLAERPWTALNRDEITRKVWGYDPGAIGPSRTVDSTAHRLRKKLERAGAESMMHTIRGVGWRLGD